MKPIFASGDGRPIPGAVATQGQNVRVEFLKKTYLHLAGAIFFFAAVCYALMHSEFGKQYFVWAISDQMHWLLVLGLFMASGWLANKFAYSGASQGLQYVGLAIEAIGFAFVTLPLLFIAQIVALQNGMEANELISQAAVITLVLFGGLTATVFITKKDFTGMGKTLMLLSWVAMGTIVAGILFGFSLGLWFSAALLALAGGYVLYYTSAIMRDFPPTYYVAAAMALFSSIALMFFYVLRILIALQRD
ncbi:MAG: Bax inhibitor-1 family protein [Deltaproteobacteria bacterium]|nr:Bax inhibitor-1 family protein [Deltaproteobacteria bacterium]